MDLQSFMAMIEHGESETVEFKRCGGQPGEDTFETVCSFANRRGGNILLGVTDDGEVIGVPKGSAVGIRRNIANVVNNPKLFTTPPTVEFEDVEVNGQLVVRVWVPATHGVFRFKGEVYDRVADADVRLRSESQIMGIYLRKYSVYTEKHIFAFLEIGDLRSDLIDRVRKMAVLRRAGHPWGAMSGEELLRSAHLHGKDLETGAEGYNRACALLFGKDYAVRSACPAYKTDAIVRKDPVNRYDDRLTTSSPLFEAYDELSEFCERHLPDPFYLEGDTRVSSRAIVVRELVANSLIHREYTSPFPAKIVIDGEGVRSENANRPLFGGRLSLSDFNPMPKNPIIAGVFAQAGLAEELGSGLRNLAKYAKVLTGGAVEMDDGDVFRTVIGRRDAVKLQAGVIGVPKQETLDSIVGLLDSQATITSAQAAEAAGVSQRTASTYLSALVRSGFAQSRGENKARVYVRSGGRS